MSTTNVLDVEDQVIANSLDAEGSAGLIQNPLLIRRAVGVPRRRTLPDEIADIGIGADREKAPVLDGEGLCAWLARIDCNYPGV